MIITLQNLYGWPALSRVNHSAAECHGNCTQHPLMRPEYRLSLADQADLYEAERNAYETDADRAARAKALAAERAARALDDEVIRRECYTRNVKERATMGLKRGEAPKKIYEPCKWMIGKFKKEAENENKKPQCWAHEFLNPVTKKWEYPRVCQRLHPGQEGWHNEGLKNPNWKPVVPPTAGQVRFAALSGTPVAAPAPKKKTQGKGRFGALEESDEEISAW
jgi:hypothetical protein